MKHFHKKRLLKLADFLDKLPRKKFDFSVIIEGYDKPSLEKTCGTVACAIGWCPIVFPRLSEYYELNDVFRGLGVRVKGGIPYRRRSMYVPCELFGMTEEEGSALFDPSCRFDNPEMGLTPLDHDATPKQVARNIRKFIKLKEAEK